MTYFDLMIADLAVQNGEHEQERLSFYDAVPFLKLAVIDNLWYRGATDNSYFILWPRLFGLCSLLFFFIVCAIAF